MSNGEDRALKREADILQEKGYRNPKIAEKLGVNEEIVERLIGPDEEITEETTIWFPGIYKGREGAYARPIAEFEFKDLIRLVQQRAEEDGTWAIETGHVGDNEHKMRKMMEWVSREENILQAIEHIYKNNEQTEKTVDFLCRDLGNASKWIGGGNARD